jgi:molecular chaperone GrpE (heat shock protein)
MMRSKSILHTLVRFAGTVAFAGAMLTVAPGCSVFSAVTNPGAMFALTDGAQMGAVVRRADAATATADHVDRLLTETKVDDDSKWVASLDVKADHLKEHLESVKTRRAYGTGPLKVLPSEAWARVLRGVQSTEKGHDNVLSMINPELYEGYGKITSKRAEIAKLKEEQASEEKAADEAKSDGEKQPHKDKAKELGQKVEAAEKDVEPLMKDFLSKAKERAAKAKPDDAKKLAPAIANLRKAVEDAKLSNQAAVLGYPRAVPTLKDSVQVVVPDITAEVIEEQTGKAPNMTNFKPDISLGGPDGVKVTLAGLSPSDMGKISPPDLLKEVTKRSGLWLTRAAKLVITSGTTLDRLSFQADLLKSIGEGFEQAGAKLPPAVVPPEVVSAGAAKK